MMLTWRRPSLGFALTVGAAVLLVGALVIAGVVPITPGGSDRIDRWLAALADPTGDRGWSLLAEDTRERAYGGDGAAYRADAGPWTGPRSCGHRRPATPTTATTRGWSHSVAPLDSAALHRGAPARRACMHR